jgi:hypothetical protein
VNVPAGVTVQSAAMNDQSPCTIGAQTVSCTIASISADQIVRLTLSAVTSQLSHYDFAFSASTPSDANAANDSGIVSTTVQPYVDPRLSAAVPVVSLDVGGTGTLTYVVTAPNRDAADVNFVISVGPPDFQLVSAVTSLGTCDTSTSTIMCHLGTVPADTSASIALMVRANRRTDATFTATLYSSVDLNAGNNQAYVDVHARQHGDATVAFATASATGTSNQAVALPTLTWSSLPSIDDVTLEIDTHSPTLTLSLRGTGVFPCTGQFTSKLTCNVSSLMSNSPQSYDLQVQSSGAASGTVTAHVTSANDTNADDNDASVSVVISAVNSTSPPTKSGGGGGGASDLLLIAGLTLLYVRRRAVASRSAG